jgi:hypothetical protein
MPARSMPPTDPRKMLEFKMQDVPPPMPPGPPGGMPSKPPSMNVSLRLGPKSFGQGGPGQNPEIQQMIMQKLQQLPPGVRSAVIQAMLKARQGQDGKMGQAPPAPSPGPIGPQGPALPIPPGMEPPTA